ncbi:MAG: glutaminyl-peptide cyclotransferase [Nitrospiraceae bacterium]|nr:MAG: glutaminyl-peptide cyclotransferase [Nitrospiraceae bacterium]
MSFVNNTFSRFPILFFLLLLIFSQPVCSDNNNHVSLSLLIDYKVINTFPHDDQAFTQGLAFKNGLLYEGTGMYGKSELTKRRLESIRPLKRYKLPSSLFGEGITVYNDKIIQLTWRSGTGLVYQLSDFRLLGSFSYTTEGWGITHDGKQLIMSDGTDSLHFLDTESYKEIKRVKVFDDSTPVRRLNELEFIKGKIYANIWKTDRIAVINPKSGQVEAWLNLEKLTAQAGGDNTYKTLNGIAYDEENDRLFVTGKLWPKIYEIKVIPAE